MHRTVMRHRLGLLEPMKSVPNIAGIIEQIDHASDLATHLMRSHGWLLQPGVPDVPVQDETDQYLRMLVLEAYAGFLEAQDEAHAAATTAHVLDPADHEIEGYAGDDRRFEVVVTGIVGAPKGHLSAQIFLRIS